VQCLKAGKVIGENSCTVKITKPVYDIIAWPTTVERDEKVRISWGALNVDSCRVTGPNGFVYGEQNGVVITTPFPKGSHNGSEAVYTLQCQTIFGGIISKDVAVTKD